MSMQMTVEQIAEKLGLDILSPGSNVEVTDGYVSDLLSDVIANISEGALWLTVQRHVNILAVAQLKKVAGIIITSGLEPDAGLVAKAVEEKICLMRTNENSFQLAGKLYALLK